MGKGLTCKFQGPRFRRGKRKGRDGLWRDLKGRRKIVHPTEVCFYACYFVYLTRNAAGIAWR